MNFKRTVLFLLIGTNKTTSERIVAIFLHITQNIKTAVFITRYNSHTMNITHFIYKPQKLEHKLRDPYSI